MHVGDYTLEDTITIPFTTRAFATGIPTALASGEVQIYEDDSVTQITAAETLTASLDSVAGFNMVSIAATAANGFENGKSYTAILAAGTVSSVSVVGEVIGHFTIGRSAAAVDLANATDGLGAIKTDTAAILVDTGTTLDDKIDTIDANVDSVLADTGTDGVVVASINTGAITADAIAADAIGASELAADAVAEIADAVWNEDATGHQTGGTFGQAIGDPGANTETMYDAVVTDAAGTNVAADVIAVKAETAAILTDTGTTLDNLVDDLESRLGTPSDLGSGATIAANLADIESQTDDIGVAGAGLTDLGGMSTGMKAEVNAEADTALADIRLDELLAADSDIDGLAPPTVGSVFHELMTKTAGSFTYDQATDSLEAVRDHVGDGTNLTEAGGDGDHLTEAGGDGDHLTAIDLPNQTMDITGNLSGSVGSVTGGLNTAAGVITTLDGLDTAQDTQHATTQGKVDTVDTVVDAIKAVTDNLPDSGALTALLASIAAILADTNELQTDDVPGLIAALNNLSTADVNGEMVDVITVDTIAELAQAQPTATPTVATALMLLYMTLRNKLDTNATTLEVHNDAGTVISKKTLSDDGTDYSEAKMASGP